MQHLKLITFFGHFVFLAGVLNAQLIRLVAPTQGSSIYVIRLKESGLTGRVSTDTLFLGIDSCVYKKNTEHVLILQKLKGYRLSTQLIDDHYISTNGKKITLKKLQAIPLGKSTDSQKLVQEVNFQIKNKNIRINNFENYSDYLKGKVESSTVQDVTFSIEVDELSDYANNFFVNYKHLDTSAYKKFNLNIYDKIEFKVQVDRVVFNVVGKYSQVDLTCQVKFNEFFLKGGYFEKKYQVTSNFIVSSASDPMQLFTDGIEELLLTLLNDPELIPAMQNMEANFSALIDSLPPISMVGSSSSDYSLENAVSAVVTIQLTNGHGSGCVLSTDGYIVTNFHVVGGDSAKINILYSDGSTKPARFIRGNPIYDLALIKVDTNFATTIKRSLKPASLGSDVYAIGTPKDLNLGQTITKGIVSAKRQFSNKTYIQSDVSVNGGNSGGALVNKDGLLVGIVNAKLVGVGVEGVSFAIPVEYIEKALKIEWK